MNPTPMELIEKQRELRRLAIEKLPSVEALMTTVGLYEPIYLNNLHEYVERVWLAPAQFDTHCIWCGQTSTFKSASRGGGYTKVLLMQDRAFNRMFECQRDNDHTYQFEFKVIDGRLIKIGQYPSVADIGSADIARFKPVLKGGLYGDLGRAVGLFSHGIGAGALVYLRRIFEKIILDERDAARVDGMPLDGFDKLHLSEKIEALGNRLPKSIHSHKRAYSLLSAGIHELSEDQCRALFPILKAVIILILDEHLRMKEQARAEKELADALVAAEASLT